MRILKEELTPGFFTMTNKEAFHLIQSRLPRLADGLKNKEYNIILDRKYSLFRGEARKLQNQSYLREIEEEMCRETGLKKWSLGLTVAQPRIRETDYYWRIYLIVNRGNEEPKTLLEDILSSSVSLTQTA